MFLIRLFRNTATLFRTVRLMLHLGYGLALAMIYPQLNLPMQRRILRHWSQAVLAIFRVGIELDNPEKLSTLTHGLLVSNHISWLDVLVLNALCPTRFVAKSEVRDWPLIGCLCRRVNTLFIERGKARAAARINQEIVALLQNGELLSLFPEGTTTDGTTVGTFHASLLQAAIDADAPIHPLALRYQDAQGQLSLAPVYIGDTSLPASLWQMLRSEPLRVRLVITPTLNPEGCDRRALANAAQRQISLALHHMPGQMPVARSAQTADHLQTQAA